MVLHKKANSSKANTQPLKELTFSGGNILNCSYPLTSCIVFSVKRKYQMILSKCLLRLGVEKLQRIIFYYVLWWSHSMKTWPPSFASVSVCDSCCLSCCHWAQPASCKPLISAFFPRLISPSLCLCTHIQYIHLVSTPRALKYFLSDTHSSGHFLSPADADTAFGHMSWLSRAEGLNRERERERERRKEE